MVRPRDSKGIFLKSEVPIDLFGNTQTSPTNPIEQYADNHQRERSHVPELISVFEWSHSESTIEKGKGKVENIQVDIVLNQYICPICINKFLKTPQNVVISEIKTPIVENILEVSIEDNFKIPSNPIFEPKFSPILLNFTLFDNMEDEEHRQ